MSQKTKRGSVSLEDKGRTESPAREIKKKPVPDEKVTDKPTEQKPVASSGKSSPAAGQSNGKSEPAEKLTGKTPEKKEDKQEKTKSVPLKSSEAAKQNGSEERNGVENEQQANGKETNGTAEIVNGTNGTSEKRDASPETQTEEDEQFPELEYDDGSDEEAAGAVRSTTRREQVKATRTPETPRPSSNKADEKNEEAAGNENKSEDKVQKQSGEISSLKKSRSTERNGDDAEGEINEEDGAKESKSGEGTVKRDTNFSKSRIKVSPYRRSTRLHDSMLANYTGNNTTMEMDISEVSEIVPTSEGDPALESSYASRRSIHGRKSYKQLGEFVPTPARRPRDVTGTAGLRPTVHVVGRKRKTIDEEEACISVGEEALAAESVVPTKRVRLLSRLMTPLTSLVRLPQRHASPSQIVGINSDLPLHGSVDIEPEALPVTEAMKTTVAPSPVDAAVEARETHRQKCTVM